MKEFILCAETATSVKGKMLDFIAGIGVPKAKIVCPPRLVYFYHNKERKNVWAMTLKDKERRSYHVILYIDSGVMTIEVGCFSFMPISVGTTLPNGICGLRCNENGELEHVLYCRRKKHSSVKSENDYYGMEADSEEYKNKVAETD